MSTPLPILIPELPRRIDCTLCPLHKEARSVGIPTCLLPDSLPPSPSHPAVLLLGQNPGFHEDRLGLPFVGKSGDFVSRVYCDAISLRSLATIYLSNVARCFHVSGDSPPPISYRTCRSYLQTDLVDLTTLHPWEGVLTILTLGAPAATHLYALCGVPKINLKAAFSRQGSLLNLTPSLPIVVFSTFHPAAVLRENNLIHAVSGHLELLLNHLTGVSPLPSKPRRIPPRPPFTV